MRTLGLETAGELGAVGIVDDGAGVLSEISFAARADHGAKLTPAVDAALRLAGMSRDGLALIAVSRGPGSFTGLRIGLAFAKGLARAIDRPLVGVPTLHVYAEHARFWPGPVWVLFPDRRESVYRAVYEQGRLNDPPAVLRLDELAAQVSQVEGTARPVLVGPGAAIHRDSLQRTAPSVTLGSALLTQPSGATVARLGRARYERDDVNELYDLEPLYTQGPPVATVNHSQRGAVQDP